MPLETGREKEKILTGSVRRGFGRLTDKEYEQYLNKTARELDRELNLYNEKDPRSIQALRTRTLATVRERVRQTVKSQLDLMRGAQERGEGAEVFRSRIDQDIRSKMEELLKGSVDMNQLSFRVSSSADTLLDFAGGVDCFVDMIRKRADGKDEVLSTTLVDLKSMGQKERQRPRADKLTDVIFYYQPGWVTKGPGGKAQISPSFFNSADYRDFIDQVAEHLFHQARYFNKI
jgi:hypothetical protein